MCGCARIQCIQCFVVHLLTCQSTARQQEKNTRRLLSLAVGVGWHASHLKCPHVLPQVTPVEDGCIFSYVIQLDMKGYVPLFFSNLIQTQHPLIISMLRRYLEGGSSHQQ